MRGHSKSLAAGGFLLSRCGGGPGRRGDRDTEKTRDASEGRADGCAVRACPGGRWGGDGGAPPPARGLPVAVQNAYQVMPFVNGGGPAPPIVPAAPLPVPIPRALPPTPGFRRSSAHYE